ncbi:MAG: Uma2 family endonuclease [Acidimicrobiia bacterium]|nr:Uma2 family endonuclease [Acidimicrobiia bacterium]
MTLQEYFQTPVSVLPQELIFGRYRVADAPFVAHQRVVLELAVALRAHARAHLAGEVVIAPADVILDAERALVLQPDLLFVSAERSEIVRERIYGAPDLVVEVLSPHPRIGRLEERVRWFAEYGVREIWLYHQIARRLDVLTCAAGAVAAVRPFDIHMPIESTVLPRFNESMHTVLGFPY